MGLVERSGNGAYACVTCILFLYRKLWIEKYMDFSFFRLSENNWVYIFIDYENITKAWGLLWYITYVDWYIFLYTFFFAKTIYVLINRFFVRLFFLWMVWGSVSDQPTLNFLSIPDLTVSFLSIPNDHNS